MPFKVEDVEDYYHFERRMEELEKGDLKFIIVIQTNEDFEMRMSIDAFNVIHINYEGTLLLVKIPAEELDHELTPYKKLLGTEMDTLPYACVYGPQKKIIARLKGQQARDNFADLMKFCENCNLRVKSKGALGTLGGSNSKTNSSGSGTRLVQAQGKSAPLQPVQDPGVVHQLPPRERVPPGPVPLVKKGSSGRRVGFGSPGAPGSGTGGVKPVAQEGQPLAKGKSLGSQPQGKSGTGSAGRVAGVPEVSKPPTPGQAPPGHQSDMEGGQGGPVKPSGSGPAQTGSHPQGQGQPQPGSKGRMDTIQPKNIQK